MDDAISRDLRSPSVQHAVFRGEFVAGTTVFPDVVVHRRGTNAQNLVVIEAKKSTNADDGEWDKTKLRAFRDPEQLGYSVTVFLWLETRISNVAATLEFADGRKVRIP